MKIFSVKFPSFPHVIVIIIVITIVIKIISRVLHKKQLICGSDHKTAKIFVKGLDFS